MLMIGIEPTRSLEHQDLNLTRIPFRHISKTGFNLMIASSLYYNIVEIIDVYQLFIVIIYLDKLGLLTTLGLFLFESTKFVF